MRSLGSLLRAQSGASSPAFEHVHALVFDAAGRTLWLGAHTGLYQSEDNGRTWAKASLPVQGHGLDVMAIAPHPTEAAVLFIATHDAGVLKTIDGVTRARCSSTARVGLLPGRDSGTW